MVTNPQVEKEIKNLLNKIFESMKKKDIKAYLSFLDESEHIVAYGSEPGERFVGYNNIKEAIKKDWERYDELALTIECLKIGSKGNVAWVASEVLVNLKFGGQEMSAPARNTMVFIKKNGK